MGKVKFILINFFISILFSTGLGQIITAEEMENLQEIKVTSSRDTFTAENFPGSLIIITDEDIKKKQHTTVEDLLRGELGLDVVQSGSLGAQTSIFIRGQGSSSTLAIIDGVQVNPNSAGGYDWGDLIIENIERIEVLKGPQSIQWGADATGGVINITTKKGKGAPKYSFAFEGGSFATFKESIQTSGAINKFDYSVSGSHLYTDGFSSVSEDRGGAGGDGTINKTISTRLGYEFSKYTDMEFVGRYIKSHDELDDSFGNSTNGFVPRPSGASNNVDEFALSLPLNTTFSGCATCFFQVWDIKFTPSLYYKDAVTIGDSTRSTSVDRTSSMDFQNNMALNEYFSLLFGAEYEHQNAMAHETASGEGYHALVDNYAGYLQTIFEYQDRLVLTAGFRHDHNTAFGNILTFKFEGGYNFKKTGTRLNTSFSKGFRAPTFDELYFPPVGGFTSSNPALVPEKIKSFEIGLKQDLLNKRLHVGLTFFNSVTTDFIQTGPSPNFLPSNFGKLFSQGLETAIKFKLPHKVSLSLSHTWNDHYIDENNAADSVNRRPAIRRPKHKFLATLDHNWNNKFTSLIGVYVRGQAFDSSSANNTGAFTTVRAAFKYKYNKNLALTFRGENLLDEDYEEVGKFGTAGISGYGGFTYSFN